MDKIFSVVDRANKSAQENIELGKLHLEDNNETYFSHLGRSWGFAYDLFVGSNKAIIHGIFPCFCMTSTTDLSKKLNSDLGGNKNE